MIGNVSNWLSYAGGALIKVADSAGSTVIGHCAQSPFEPLHEKTNNLHMPKLRCRSISQ